MTTVSEYEHDVRMADADNCWRAAYSSGQGFTARSVDRDWAGKARPEANLCLCLTGETATRLYPILRAVLDAERER